jgi:hypothetical protein
MLEVGGTTKSRAAPVFVGGIRMVARAPALAKA